MRHSAEESPLPLYHRVYLLLRQRIAEGAWPADVPMPGEHELAGAHGVSRITVRRALQRLNEEGLVRRRRGAGTFARPPHHQPRREDLYGLMDNLLVMGRQTDVALLDLSYVAAPAEVAAALEVVPGTLVQKSVRLRSVACAPFSHLTAWVPERIGRTYQAQDLATQPLLLLLERAGLRAAKAEQVMSAKLADGTVAPLLRVPPGSALLWVRRQVRDEAGQVIEALEALYRPDLYEYQIAMTRGSGTWDLRRDRSGVMDAAG